MTNAPSNQEIIITTQEELDRELSKFPWHDSFVREIHGLTPSYVVPRTRAVTAPDSPWCVRILICSQETEYPSVEFIFEAVQEMRLSSRCDLKPSGKVYRDEIVCSITGSFDEIRAKRLRIRPLGPEAWGIMPRYCAESLFDEDSDSYMDVLWNY